MTKVCVNHYIFSDTSVLSVTLLCLCLFTDVSRISLKVGIERWLQKRNAVKCISPLFCPFDFVSCLVFSARLCLCLILSLSIFPLPLSIPASSPSSPLYLIISSLNLYLLSPPPPCDSYSAIDVPSPSEKTVIVSGTESVPADSSSSAPPSDSAPSEVSEAAVVMDQDTPAAPSQSNKNIRNQLNKTKAKLCSSVVH